jgi:hypothetical protein
MNRKPLSRRSLLRGAGGILVGLPALESLRGSPALAASTRPKRLIVFFTPNGTFQRYPVDYDFVPKQVGPNFVLGNEVAPLEPHRNRLLILSGVNAESCKPAVNGIGDLHSVGMSQMLTGVQYVEDNQYIKFNNRAAGFAGGISVDQYIAKKIGTQTLFPSLEFGVCTATDYPGVHPFSRMIYSGRNTPVPPRDDPHEMFLRLFSDASTTGGTAAILKAHTQRRSVLDFVKEDFVRLQSRLGSRDRQKLDAHLTAVRELETRLAKPPTETTLGCGGGSLENPSDPLSTANFAVTGKNQMDLLTLALKCDVTRVASLQWSWARSTLVHTWAGSTHSHHDMSHDIGSPELSGVNTWYAKQLAYLASALAAADEGDGTSVLDHSVIYWCSEVNWGYTHSFDDMRVFLLGNCGGALKTGQHLALNAQPHQKLLVTLMNAMGVLENEFGETSYGTGPLPGVLA